MAQGIAMLADGLKSHAVSLAHAVDTLNALVRGEGVKKRSRRRDAPTDQGDSNKPTFTLMKESA
jgi:hypothetical protein